MNIWGADTEQVLDQARALRTGDERVTALREALDPVVASVAWTGADADAFRELWQGCSTQIQELAAQLGSGAEGLARERSEEHTSELQSRGHLVCRLLLEKKKVYGIAHVSQDPVGNDLEHASIGL